MHGKKGLRTNNNLFHYQTELVDCANRLGAEMLGLQAELDKSVCSNEVRRTVGQHSDTLT